MRMTGDSRKELAKQLLKEFHSGESDAVATFSEHHPRSIPSDQAKLADAQLVLARSRGFDSWPKLRRDVVGQQLRKAIWDGNTNAVEQALQTEPETLHDPGRHPRWGGTPTPLQLAAERGQMDIVRFLIDRGADVDSTKGYSGWTALHLAAFWGHEETVRILIEQGATVDIISAVLLDDIARVGQLLDETPERAVTPGNSDGPPLHYAVSPDDVATMLIRHGATLDTIDSMGNTPLGSALNRGDRARSVARCLIAQGSEADACQLAALGESERLKELLDVDLSTLSFTGKIGVNAVVGTPLHASVAAGHIECVRLLLEHGADPNARADMGQTPLHLAPSSDIARLLIEAGADPSATDDEHATTPLVWANVGIDIHGESEARRELVDYLESVT
jgi:ankyrin repeat protein